MPGPKNGERPYLAVPETPFLGVVFWSFSAHFLLFLLPYPTTSFIFWHFIIYILLINTQLNAGYATH